MNRFFTLLLAVSCLTAVGQYQVGDVGPAGGWVFYVDAENQFEDWDYLEAWPHTFSFFQLLACDYSPYLSSSELGTGENNTMVFASNDDTFSAFDFAVLFDGGSRNDWFLPSKSELEALNASSVSALINSGEGYSAASSSIFNGCHWWTYDINNGWGIEDDLYSWEWVLPIRSFQTADDGIVCGQGTIWDEATQLCLPLANPSDLNLDGCVDVQDFMGHLAAFGEGCNGNPQTSLWQCGDPLEYQGYDYETVQIGEQCWFAENLRAEHYRDGTSIDVTHMNSNAAEFGLLYRGAVVLNELPVCPIDWAVSADEDWLELEHFVGANVQETLTFGYSDERLLGSGEHLKPGPNSVGFNALFGGYVNGSSATSVTGVGVNGQWWTSSLSGIDLIYRNVENSTTGISRVAQPTDFYGFSIRCIKDTE